MLENKVKLNLDKIQMRSFNKSAPLFLSTGTDYSVFRLNLKYCFLPLLSFITWDLDTWKIISLSVAGLIPPPSLYLLCYTTAQSSSMGLLSLHPGLWYSIIQEFKKSPSLLAFKKLHKKILLQKMLHWVGQMCTFAVDSCFWAPDFFCCLLLCSVLSSCRILTLFLLSLYAYEYITSAALGL